MSIVPRLYDGPSLVLLLCLSWLPVWPGAGTVVVAAEGRAAEGRQPAEAPSDNGEDGEEAAPTGVVILEGQVVNFIGQGEKDVAVTVFLSKGDEEGEQLGEAVTDNMGDFKIYAPERIEAEVIVKVAKKDFTAESRRLTVGQNEWPDFVDFQLSGTLAVSGMVLAVPGDTPLAGATVSLELMYDERSATTDEEGRFAFDRLSPTKGRLIVTATGYGREVDEVVVGEESELAPIKLKPERIVDLTVVDDLGKPVAGAMIELLDKERQDLRTSITDGEGAAVIKGLHFDAEKLSVRLYHDDHVNDADFDRELETPPDTARSKHELVMHRAGRIVGRVTAGPLRDPVVGARLMTGDSYSDDTPRAWTDFEGKYEIKGVPPGAAFVTVHAGGFAPQVHEVEVGAGDRAELDLSLASGGVVSGTVVNKDGAPVSRAYVQAYRWKGCTTLGLRAFTGPDGRFEIRDTPDEPFELHISGRSGGKVVLEVTPGTPVEATLEEPDGLPEGGMAKGADAPDIDVTATDGSAIKLADLRGKHVLLDFWATWCGPCVAEVPRLVEIHKVFGGREDFEIISVSLDFEKKAFTDFVSERGMTWRHVYGEEAQSLANGYGVKGIPALFLIGKDGKIEASGLYGEYTHKAVAQALNASQDDDGQRKDAE